MHSVLITFKNAAKMEDLGDTAAQTAEAIRGVPGLVSKAWIMDGDTLGGFYVFSDKQAADAYLEGEIISELKNAPPFSDFQIRHFSMMDELSVLNGTPSKTLAER